MKDQAINPGKQPHLMIAIADANAVAMFRLEGAVCDAAKKTLAGGKRPRRVLFAMLTIAEGEQVLRVTLFRSTRKLVGALCLSNANAEKQLTAALATRAQKKAGA
ncbi:MAG: hypothetical protein LAO20_10325 [Acidobacteriia bacterium]|nr:hypothetical protein [Terriglobia bacterium]